LTELAPPSTDDGHGGVSSANWRSRPWIDCMPIGSGLTEIRFVSHPTGWKWVSLARHSPASSISSPDAMQRKPFVGSANDR